MPPRRLAIVNGIDRQSEGEQGKDAQSEADAFVLPGGKAGKALSNMGIPDASAAHEARLQRVIESSTGP